MRTWGDVGQVVLLDDNVGGTPGVELPEDDAEGVDVVLRAESKGGWGEGREDTLNWLT